MSLFDNIEILEPELEKYDGNKVFLKILDWCDEVYSPKRKKDLTRMIETSPKLFLHEKKVLLSTLERCVIVNSNNGIYRTVKFAQWEKSDRDYRQKYHKELRDIEN